MDARPRRLLLCFTVLAFVAPIALRPRVAVASPAAHYRDGEVLVRFRDGVRPSTVDRAHGAVHGRVARRFTSVRNLQLVTLPPGMRVDEALRAYRRDPAVAYATPNYVVHA